MATGYTHSIIEGDGITFRDFMLKCVRAMGVFIELRDEPSSMPIPKSLDSSSIEHYEKSLNREKAELARVEALTDAECDAEAAKAYQKALESRQERLDKMTRDKARYELMLAQVEAWEPPTPEHEGFKKFMREQVTTSIEHDCDRSYYEEMPVQVLAEDWRAAEIESARRSVAYHEEKLLKARSNLQERNAWIEAFWASLPAQAPLDSIAYVTEDGDGIFSAHAEDGTFILKVPEETASRWPTRDS